MGRAAGVWSFLEGALGGRGQRRELGDLRKRGPRTEDLGTSIANHAKERELGGEGEAGVLGRAVT